MVFPKNDPAVANGYPVVGEVAMEFAVSRFAGNAPSCEA